MRLIWHPNTGVYLCESVWCWICTYYLVKEECSTEEGSIDVIRIQKGVLVRDNASTLIFFIFMHHLIVMEGFLFTKTLKKKSVCIYLYTCTRIYYLNWIDGDLSNIGNKRTINIGTLIKKKDKYRKKCNYRLNCKKGSFISQFFVCLHGWRGGPKE